MIAEAAQLIHVLHVVARHFQILDNFNKSSCKRGIRTFFFVCASRLGKRLYKSKLFWICMESSVFRVTMGPYGISNNERHVHIIDGHTKCLYAAKFALEWKISDTEKVASITWSNLPGC